MSKPNPSITANLLNSILEKKGETQGAEGEGGVGTKVASNAHLKGSPAKVKLGPTRKTAGAGHMRSSPRGK